MGSEDDLLTRLRVGRAKIRGRVRDKSKKTVANHQETPNSVEIEEE